MQASRFCKTLFQHSVRVHSHHGSVMFTGIGTASQQAEYARQICNAMRVWAFVYTEALLADARAINKCELDFLWKDTGKTMRLVFWVKTHCLRTRQRVYFDIINHKLSKHYLSLAERRWGIMAKLKANKPTADVLIDRKSTRLNSSHSH